MGVPLRVLLIEDNEDDAQLTLRELRKGGYDPVHERVDTPLALDAALDRQKWDVVISDYVMPRFSAPAALAIMTSTGLDLPFIIVSGAIGEETAVAAMRAGAHDFVSKGNLTRLVPAVNRELREAEMRRERRRAETALRESEERYRRLVEFFPDAVLVIRDGIITFANPAAAAIAGIPQERLVGRRVLDFVSPEYRDASARRMRQAADEAQPAPPAEIRIRHADGSLVDVESVIVPLSYDDGPALQVVFRDITARKAGERRIQEYQAQLKSLASEVTLSEERERHRVARVLHDSVAQVLAISKIKLSEAAPLAASDELARKLGEVMELLRQSIQSTRTLIFDLSSPVLYELGLRAAMERLAEETQEVYGLTVGFSDDGAPKPLSQDALALVYKCVRELVANVVVHSGAHNVAISSRRDDDTLNIAVEDDGSGFDVAEMWKHVQKDGGLGLFGIRERLNYFGGVLDVSSEPGKGTVASLKMPLETESQVKVESN